MIAGVVIGLVIGFVLGVGATLLYVRSRGAGRPAEPPAPEPAIVSEPAAERGREAEPAAPAADDEVHAAVDAAAGLLDELETRYRDRPRPVGDDDEPVPPPVRRRPRRPRP